MPAKKVTIYDVSREAGVSLATVSRVINGSQVVKEATRQRVLEVIKRLDFKPNEIARGLAKSKTTTIAVVFPQSLFAHVKDMIGGIGDASRSLKYNITIHTTDDIGEDNMVDGLIEKLVKSRVDGVILFNNDNLPQEIERLKPYDIPFVVIGDRFSGENVGSVFADAYRVTYDITKQYLDEGKHDIVFFTVLQNLLKKEDLIDGIRDAFKEKGIEWSNYIEVDEDYEKSFEFFKQYFTDHKPEVVIASYDKEGVAIVNAAKSVGIRIPEDMKVISMMNTTYALMSDPKLTSVNIPVYNMGALALRLLTKILNDEEIETKEVVVNHLLIERDTTK